MVILAKSITKADRDRIVAELESAKIGVLDLNSSNNVSHGVRGLADSGPETFLELVGRAAMESHGHPEIEGENVAWVDRDRRYVHVTDGFLDLIGYDRDEVLGRLIDDFTYPASANTREVFVEYLKDGHMIGHFLLRHKNGEKVPIDFEAGILPDGYMYSNMRRASQESKEKVG